MLFNTHDIVLLITIYQCVLFALFLLTFKKGNKQSNLLLALFLLSYAAIPLDSLINYGAAFRAHVIEVSPNIFYFFGNAYWLEAVILLFYVRSLIYKKFTFSKYDFLLFVPFLCYLIYEINIWFIVDHGNKVAMLNNYQAAEEPLYSRFIGLFRECFRLFCGLLCLIELQRYQTKIKDKFANIESVDLTWLKILVIGFLFIRADAILVSLAMFSSFEFGLIIDYELLGLISNYTVLLLISVLIFFSLRFSSVFKGIESNETTAPPLDKSPIDPQLVDNILLYMKNEKPYLNHLLTLDNLASQLSIPPRYLSQAINRHFKQNFFEFINGYRIDESKQLLQLSENRQVTMLKIMDRAGFNSKATFNTFFKKLVGLTPTQYRKEHSRSDTKAA
ncbi:AraC-type DNA-binding domain-containing protein [Shewanella violacea DSS12]|uniref:AraC-type DNA-binding domain-containing protein n=1 Tax=Shewanella violacea (strain JCM 10179 / CIP 106290 / LMG 19151 / DSS12) TaxID=637905 RepID=D4ZML3_SHEVD|nr:AraC-type DNA-binding domain-containing protein [Shewanella violacea DSS12]